MSDEQQREPQAFRDFDELYNAFVRCDWHDPTFKELLQKLETFMAQHRELYANEFVKPCIENARGHCRGAGVTFKF